MGFKNLYTGVSGLRSQTTAMEVIGNNLTNVNTAGFKRSRVTFKDMFYQTLKAASSGNGDTIGGINPQQVGSGTKIGSIDQIFTQGQALHTQRAFDFMVEGDDFFVAQNLSNGELMLTRNGAFNLDGDGFLVDSLGNKILGFNVDRESGAVDQMAAAIQVPDGGIDPNATTLVNYNSNLKFDQIQTNASDTSNTWEVFSGGENFGNMAVAITGGSGAQNIYGSGYYRDSRIFQIEDEALTSLTSITLPPGSNNLAADFNVGDTISIRQGTGAAANIVTREVASSDSTTGTISWVDPLPTAGAGTTFTVAGATTITNLTNTSSTQGQSGDGGNNLGHNNDILKSQVVMVNGRGQIIASFYRVGQTPGEFIHATATTESGTEMTVGVGEFQSIQDLKEGLEQALRDNQLSNNVTLSGTSGSNELEVNIDKFGVISFSGSGVVDEFRLLVNNDNKAMLDRFQGIASTVAVGGGIGSLQGSVNSTGRVVDSAGGGFALSRSINASKNWYDVSVPADDPSTNTFYNYSTYGYSDTLPSTEYGMYGGLRLDGGAIGQAFGILTLSATNGLGQTVTKNFYSVARFADSSQDQFSTMGELAKLIQNTLRSGEFSTVARDGSLLNDSTATAQFVNGRLSVSTTSGSFQNLRLYANNDEDDTGDGVTLSDQTNFGTVLGNLSSGVNGKTGSSNLFINADVISNETVFDSTGNWHTSVSYFVKDRSSGLTNREWKFKGGLNPNENSFAKADPESRTVYRNTFNSIEDTFRNRGTLAFDQSSGDVLSVATDSRYREVGNLTFTSQENSVQASESEITLNYVDTTSFAGKTTIQAVNQDGFGMGTLVRLDTPANKGEIEGYYSNGQRRLLAKIGLMSISNPEGLTKVGNSYWVQSPNSSPAIKTTSQIFAVDSDTPQGVDNISSKIQSYALEGSNVDLTEELTNMIITQRSYSAAGKNIVTSDEMLQEALSLKR